MAIKHRWEGQWATSTKQQTDAATALDNTDIITAFRVLDWPLSDITPELLDDRERFGSGIEFPQEQKVEKYKTSLTLRNDLDATTFGLLAAFALGACSSGVQGETAAYQHVITPAPIVTSKALPFMTVHEFLHSGEKRKHTGLVINKLTLKGGEGRAEVTAELLGTGRLDTSDLTMPALVTQNYLRRGNGKFELGIKASEVDLSQELIDIELGFGNGVEDGKALRFSDGLYSDELVMGKREIPLKFRIRMPADTSIRDLLRNQTAQSMILTFTGPLIAETYYETVKIEIPNFQLRSAKEAADGEVMIYDCEANPFHDAVDGAITITVINTTTAYLELPT